MYRYTLIIAAARGRHAMAIHILRALRELRGKSFLVTLDLAITLAKQLPTG